MIEELTKARDSQIMACDDIRQAMKKASGVESIVLLHILAKAEKVRQEIENFKSMYEIDHKE